jgi:hypothetical protein
MPLTGDRMPAVGRWVRAGGGVADGVGDAGADDAGAGLVVASAGILPVLPVLAVLPAAGAAVPVTGADALGVVPAVGAVALEAGVAVDPTGAEDRVVDDTVGVADTVDVAAPVGAAWGLVALGLDGVAVTAGDAWPSRDAVGWFVTPAPALAVGASWSVAADDGAAVGAELVNGSVAELTSDPTTPVTGSVTAWRSPETPDVSPDSNEGRLSVAALA